MSDLVGADAELLETDGVYDMVIDSVGDIKTKDFFDTAILMSLYCERRAVPSEMPSSHLRRGWIGNESTPGFEIGSKLWLFEQARLTRSVLNSVDSVAKESLVWMVSDNIAKSIEAQSRLSKASLVLEITITRPNSSVVTQYFDLWENTGK